MIEVKEEKDESNPSSMTQESEIKYKYPKEDLENSNTITEHPRVTFNIKNEPKNHSDIHKISSDPLNISSEVSHSSLVLVKEEPEEIYEVFIKEDPSKTENLKDETDELSEIQQRFQVQIKEEPEEIINIDHPDIKPLNTKYSDEQFEVKFLPQEENFPSNEAKDENFQANKRSFRSKRARKECSSDQLAIEEIKIIKYEPLDQEYLSKPSTSSKHSKYSSKPSKFSKKPQPIKFECSHCHKKFLHHAKLDAHICSSNQNRFICDFCGFKFVNRSKLKDHMTEKHAKVEKFFQCDHCPRNFVIKSNLWLHMKIHQKSKKTCEFCKKEVRMAGYAQHVRRTHKNKKKINYGSVKKYECSKCSQSFTRLEILKQHEATHDMKFECKKCKKKFALKISYENHLRTHENLKSFKCEKCEKGFNTRKGLTQHGLTHIETKDFKCEDCGKFFNSWPRLHQHMKNNLKCHMKKMKRNKKNVTKK
jgi:KRAB domain-containing zinc finger protein